MQYNSINNLSESFFGGGAFMGNEMYLLPVDNSLRVIRELFPAEQTPTKFDKTIELIKALTANSITGLIGQAIETTGKVCSTLISGKQRVQAVKFVTDAYEVKLRSEVELARLNNESQKTKALTLYVEKSFQARMDELNKEILLRSRSIELKHSENMRQINAEHEKAIIGMNLIAKEHLHSIDKRYAEMIARNENYCLLYRQYLKSLQDGGITPGVMIKELSNKSLDMLATLANNPSISIERMNAALEAAKQLIDFVNRPEEYFIPFDKFINQKNMIEDWSNGTL